MTDTVHASILGLRVTRAFRDTPIDRDTLDALLEAGRWTGSSKNRQGWMFLAIRDRENLERLAEAGRFTDPIRASAVTVALVKTAEGNDFDIGRAAQNIMLSADAHGLGSCPVTLHHEAKAREALNLPEGTSCRWVIAIGHADAEAEAEVRAMRRAAGTAGRKPADEVIRFGPM